MMCIRKPLQRSLNMAQPNTLALYFVAAALYFRWRDGGRNVAMTTYAPYRAAYRRWRHAQAEDAMREAWRKVSNGHFDVESKWALQAAIEDLRDRAENTAAAEREAFDNAVRG